MTSEVFKDKIPGAIVLVAKTGKEALEVLSKSSPDLCVIDFDLPDVDGPALIEAVRKTYQGPILMTAYPDDVVSEAVKDHLFTYNDAGGWISKPVDVQALGAKIDRFLVDKYRTDRRFESNIATELVGKASGRGKRAPKVKGKIVNISMGGACISLDGNMKVKKAQELQLTLSFPSGEAPKKGASVKSKTKAAPKTRKSLTTSSKDLAKIKAKVAWVNNSANTLGLQFGKLTEPQKKELVSYLRHASALE
jgi:CheY-like chemotaxis protein